MAIKFLNTVAVDTDVLYVDAANDRVGIGTISPSKKLHVTGDTYIEESGTGQTLLLGRSNGQPTIKADSSNGGHMIIDSYSNFMSLNHYISQNVVLVAGGGNVGIGTTSPGARLDVESTTTPLHLNRTGGATALIGLDIAGVNRGLIGATTTAAFVSYSTAAAPLVTVANTGGVQFNTYGAGTLVTDASGNITVSSGGGAGGPYLPLAGGTMTGNIAMGDNNITGLSQLAFTDNLRFDDLGADNYLRLTYGDAGPGGLQIYDGDNTLQGYLYADGGGTSSFGLLSGAGAWGVKVVENAHTSLYHNGNQKLFTTSTGIDVTGTAQMDTGITEGIHYVGTAVEHWGDGGTGMSFPSNDTLSLKTASSDRLYITSGGDVGIGTTSPSQKLHVAGNMRLQNQLYDSTNSTGSNGQVLTKTSGGTIWADNKGLTPVTPGGIVATIVGETIEIAFNQSTTSNIDYYQVWSSDDGGDYGIIGQIAPADFSSTMTVVDTTFVTGGTMSYRVYAVKSGVYSPAGTVSKTYTVGSLSVTDMTVVNLNTAYYIQYEKPISRFIDHVEIYMDSQTTSAALNRSNATIVYSGQNASYMRNVGTSSNFHQFWVEIVTT